MIIIVSLPNTELFGSSFYPTSFTIPFYFHTNTAQSNQEPHLILNHDDFFPQDANNPAKKESNCYLINQNLIDSVLLKPIKNWQLNHAYIDFKENDQEEYAIKYQEKLFEIENKKYLAQEELQYKFDQYGFWSPDDDIISQCRNVFFSNTQINQNKKNLSLENFFCQGYFQVIIQHKKWENFDCLYVSRGYELYFKKQKKMIKIFFSFVGFQKK